MELSPGYRDSATTAVNTGDVVAGMYVVREEVARTDTGVVFEARDMMLDRAVALKLAWRDPDVPSMILEARRCALVKDPSSVAIFAMGRHDGVEFVVGERVNGTILCEYLEASPPLVVESYLAKLHTVYSAVTRAHDCGIAIGEISGATMLVTTDDRLVLGRLSLSQVPAFGPLGQLRAPEVVRGDVEATDPTAAEAIDLYGMGCIAIELARGTPPFAGDDPQAELRGHAHQPPPRLADLRPDLPVDLSDLVEWCLAKHPVQRPPSAGEVLLQLDSIIDRHGTHSRTVRVLIVDDDTARARWMWSLARRAYSSAHVEIASEGTDAAHKLNRDHPDIVFVDAQLRGVMNALELCMYARGLESEAGLMIVVGEVNARDRAMFAENIQFIPEDGQLAATILDRVRDVATQPPRRRRTRITVSG
ncbi:MAG: protein kinase domain-containing protein [Kofleriaceae bacterium]